MPGKQKVITCGVVPPHVATLEVALTSGNDRMCVRVTPWSTSRSIEVTLQAQASARDGNIVIVRGAVLPTPNLDGTSLAGVQRFKAILDLDHPFTSTIDFYVN